MGLTTNRIVWEYTALVFLLLTAVFSVLFYLQGVFVSIIIGLILIVLISGASSLFNYLTADRSRDQKRMIVLVIVISVFCAVLLAAFAFVSSATRLTSDLFQLFDYRAVSEQIMDAAAAILANGQSGSTNVLHNAVRQVVLSGLGLSTSVKSTLSDISSILLTAVLSVPLTVSLYFTKRDAAILKINKMLPPQYRRSFWDMVASILQNINLFLVIKLLEAFILSFIFSVGFYLSGLPYALPAGILVGVFSVVVPYVGVGLIAVPVSLLAYSTGTAVFVGVAGTFVFAAVIDYFFLLPNFLSADIKVHPLTAIALTLAAWKIFGLLGMIAALPVYLVYKVVLTACYDQLVYLFPEKDPSPAAEESSGSITSGNDAAASDPSDGGSGGGSSGGTS